MFLNKQKMFLPLYFSSHLLTHGQWPLLTRQAGGGEIVVCCQNLRSEETETAETTLDNNKRPPSHCHSEAV